MKIKGFKKIVVLLLVITSVFTIAGCNKTGDASSASKNSASKSENTSTSKSANVTANSSNANSVSANDEMYDIVMNEMVVILYGEVRFSIFSSDQRKELEEDIDDFLLAVPSLGGNEQRLLLIKMLEATFITRMTNFIYISDELITAVKTEIEETLLSELAEPIKDGIEIILAELEAYSSERINIVEKIADMNAAIEKIERILDDNRPSNEDQTQTDYDLLKTGIMEKLQNTVTKLNILPQDINKMRATLIECKAALKKAIDKYSLWLYNAG